MRTLLAVLRREIWERRQIVLLGLFLGVLCPVVAGLPLGLRISPTALRDGLAFGVSIGFFALMSLLVGLGLFASDQATGRVGFYLARPIRPWQLLVGRVLAASAVLLVGTVLVALPTLLLAGKLWQPTGGNSLQIALWLVALSLAAAHVAAVALRLRGRWTILDLGASATTALLVGSILQRAQEARLFAVGQVLLPSLAVVAMAAAGLALWVQLRHGGVQRDRLHAAFSLTFWLLVLSATALYDVRLRIALSKGWDDIESFATVVPSSDGTAVWLSTHEALPRTVSFVLDLERGTLIPVTPVTWQRREPLVEGRTAAWLDCTMERATRNRGRRAEACTFRVLDLAADPPRAVDLGTSRAPWDRVQTILLSPDGSKLAELSTNDRLTLYALPEGRPIHQIEVPDFTALLRVDSDGSLVAVAEIDQELKVQIVSAAGEIRSIEPALETPAGGVQMWDGSRWLIDSAAQFPSLPAEILLDAQGKRLVGDWAVELAVSDLELRAQSLDGRRFAPLPLPRTEPLDRRGPHDGFSYPLLRMGPELEPGRVVVAVGEVHRRKVELPFWKTISPFSTRGWDLDFTGLALYENVENWTAHYVDVGAGRLVASLEGFKPLRKRIETDSGPEAWLQDERGMPYRFDPKRLDPENPISSLEPVFRPPWDDDARSDEP